MSNDFIENGESLRPLPAGSVIDFCGERGVVVRDDGGAKITVDCDGRQSWYWSFEGANCQVVSVPGDLND